MSDSMAVDSRIKVFGTGQAPDVLRSVRLGPLSFLYTAEGIRRICWHGTELVRAIAWPIRDENWGTFAPVVVTQEVQADDATFSAHLGFSVSAGQLSCDLRIHASDQGDLRLDLTMTPTEGAFSTNRAGFTVLHPIKGIAGAPLTVTHSDGATEETEFPRLISPGQPVFDISGLRYGLDGRAVDIVFSGEVFEMEDQRNWSDASYKTYCVPLVFPFTYQIDAPVTQTIEVSLSGQGAQTDQAQDQMPLVATVTDDNAPDIGLVVEPGWLNGDAVGQSGVGQSGVGHLRARVGPENDPDALARLFDAAQGVALDIELVIPDAAAPEVALSEAGHAIKAAGLSPTRIIPLRAGYLGSHQPSGPWPEGPTPAEVVAAARRVFADIFPQALIGGGMLTNFTEFNRCPPDPDLCDFVTHGNTAIVHAGDDMSVVETLETLPQIYDSARAIAAGTPYRLGLLSIGMRSNPYGAAVAENPSQIRRTMGREDPRHRGLFAAAWAVAVLGTTEGQGVEALCLGAPVGPFGVSYDRQPYEQAYYDDTPGAAVYPIFHVVKAAAAMAGQPRLHVAGLPEGIHAYGVRTPTGAVLMLANVSAHAQTVHLPHPGQAAVLDETTFSAATTQLNWLETAQRQEGSTLNLEAYAVAFLEERHL